MTILETGQQANEVASLIGVDAAIPATAGWFDDPEAQHRLRYFDGQEWTLHVTHFGPTPCSGCG